MTLAGKLPCCCEKCEWPKSIPYSYYDMVFYFIRGTVQCGGRCKRVAEGNIRLHLRIRLLECVSVLVSEVGSAAVHRFQWFLCSESRFLSVVSTTYPSSRVRALPSVRGEILS